MKTHTLFLTLGLACLPTHLAFGAEDIVAIVQNEIKKTQQNVRTEWYETKRKLEQLKSQRDRTLQDAKRRVEMEKAGIDFFKDAITLMTARYVNERGDHQPGMEISVKDQEFVNRLFQKYLAAQPLQGRTSAGEAIRMLNWGISRMNELIKVHATPLENTNPELEILAYQIKEVEKSLARTTELAQRLGIKPEAETDTKTVEGEAGKSADRKPASVETEKEKEESEE